MQIQHCLSIVRTIYIVLLFLLAFCLPQKVDGQSFDEYRERTQRQFNDRRQTVQKEFNSLRAKVNKEFSDLLGHEWQPSGTRKITRNPLWDYPSIPPQTAKEVPDKPVQKECKPISVSSDGKAPVPPAEIEFDPSGTQTSLRFVFYGTDCKVSFDRADRVRLKNTAAESISQIWTDFTSVKYSNLIADFDRIRKELELCDWASLKLAQKISAEIYGDDYPNEMVVLQSYMLTQCGLMTCMLLDKSGRLHLLAATDRSLFGYPAYFIDNTELYQVDGQDVESGTVPRKPMPGTQPLRMRITSPGKIKVNVAKTDKGANINRNDIDFYADYPAFYDNSSPSTSFSHIASVRLGAEAESTLYPYLKEKLEGLGEEAAVQLILIYLYKVFPYKEDEKVWGKERYFFPEETLYYEFSDCEDRAILFTRIVRDLLGLKTALLYMPGHLSAAVHFNSDVDGDAVKVNGVKYVICDPTYINANVGQAMPGWDVKDIEVLPL